MEQNPVHSNPMEQQPKFVISASEASAMAQSIGAQSVLHLLPTLVAPAESLARPPISNFHVAAVGLGGDGNIYIGVNLEFPNLPLHHSVHAEQSLLTNLSIHNCPSLVAFAVSAAPCGHCRQFLQELRNSRDIRFCIAGKENNSYMNLFDMLPTPFGPFVLLDQKMPLLLEVKSNGLVVSRLLSNGDSESKRLSNGGDSVIKESKRVDFYEDSEGLSIGDEIKCGKNETLLVDEALKAANNSHAPYSGCPSGVALMDCDGNVYRGSYAESAAYNPSLGPVQAALIAFVAAGGGAYERIVAAALVEVGGGVVVQEDTTKLILKKVAPTCSLKVVHCFNGQNGS